MALFRNLGPFRTTAIGHGEMPLTIENNRGHDVGIETLHASLDAGCRHIDTAWAYYTPGEEEQTGEKLVREARVRKSPWPPRWACAALGRVTSRFGHETANRSI